ncbi:MoaD/ThiS family protein [Sphingomonas montanisoli]|uniref:MoaD/ThiS family protein n=1 Tax=Sphingomonas montanisoli TaxID=2606412 RepID=A0A5D9CBB9_9SPHN|nr:MoaD/ThiS family protein [Sphingomonas montanisoli]TZG28656.1 MoaD/ThiS family protein [Sphingomonas montanisoli]
MAIDLLYFAGIREAIGLSGERVDPPASVARIVDLVDWLVERGNGYVAAFADRTRLRAAIDDRFVDLTASLAGAREIALFPPVTGGAA